MAAGSSPVLPVPGSAGVGRGHQRTVSTQQPSARKLPGCPIPSASNSRHGDRPDVVLAATGWTGPPSAPQVAPHQTPQVLMQDVWSCCWGMPRSERWKRRLLPQVPPPPQPTQPSCPRGAGRAHPPPHWSPSSVGQAPRIVASLQGKGWPSARGIRCPSARGITPKLALKVNRASRDDALISNIAKPLDL